MIKAHINIKAQNTSETTPNIIIYASLFSITLSVNPSLKELQFAFH